MLHYAKLRASFTSESARAFYIIACFAGVLLLPQIMMQSPIIGVDALFHFNRFYDTAMQIEHGTFNYFQTMYGFNGSGRIINAVYGPIFAYLVGALLLICQSWFVFELVSSFLVVFVAGIGIRYLARAMNLSFTGQIVAAMLYMTMPLTNQWMLNQSFTAIGAAVIPFVLIYGVYFYTHKDNYPWINLSIALAILTQIHFLSALIACFGLLCFFIGAQIRSTDTLRTLFWPLIRAMALFGLLISNLVITLIDVNASNELKAPFIPSNIMDKTMHFSWGVSSLRQYGLVGMVLIVTVLVGLILYYRQFKGYQRDFATIGLIFLVLSSSLIPWDTLRHFFPTIVNTLQFPSRLAVISNIILAILAGYFLTQLLDNIPNQRLSHLFIISGIVCFNLASVYVSEVHSAYYFKQDRVMKHRSYMVDRGQLSPQEERIAWTGQDLTIAMNMIQKQTPDYLPVSNLSPTDDAYLLYRQDILLNDLHPEMKTSPELTLEWDSNRAEKNVLVPTIVYSHSKVTHNGQVIENPTTSKVGALIIDAPAGKNTITNHYEPNRVFWPVIYLNIFTWIGALIALGWSRHQKG
jgi:hypothetical protein